MALSLSGVPPLPPGARSLPPLGETIEWARDPLRFAVERAERFGPVWRTHLLGRPCAVLLGPEANRFILSSHRHLFSSRLGWGRPITSLIGGGLSLIDGLEHQRHRRMIQPVLHGQILGRYFDTMTQLAARHAASWATRQPIRMFDAFKQLSFEIAARLMLGARTADEVSALDRQFHIFTGGLFAPPAWRVPGTPYGRAWEAGRRLRHSLAPIVSRRRNDPNGPGDDILGLLIDARDETGRGFDDAELIDELLVLLWAGHDTVTSLLTWTLLELLRHPAELELLRTESERASGDAPLELKHLKQLPHLDHVLREAERLHPPAPGGFRGVVEEFEYGGYRVPAGWTVMYSIVYTHHMPELWHDPELFDPQRFAAPREEGNKPFHLIGFGGGPRVCVGLAFAKMQMQIVMSHLLRAYSFELVPDQSFRPVPVPTKMPKDGLVVRVRNKR